MIYIHINTIFFTVSLLKKLRNQPVSRLIAWAGAWRQKSATCPHLTATRHGFQWITESPLGKKKRTKGSCCQVANGLWHMLCIQTSPRLKNFRWMEGEKNIIPSIPAALTRQHEPAPPCNLLRFLHGLPVRYRSSNIMLAFKLYTPWQLGIWWATAVPHGPMALRWKLSSISSTDTKFTVKSSLRLTKVICSAVFDVRET